LKGQALRSAAFQYLRPSKYAHIVQETSFTWSTKQQLREPERKKSYQEHPAEEPNMKILVFPPPSRKCTQQFDLKLFL